MPRRTRSAKRRRPRVGLLVQILVPVGLLVVVIGLAFVLLRPVPPKAVAIPTIPPCPKVQPVLVGNILVPAGPVAGYCQDQLINAAQIMRAAATWTENPRAAEIGVMTAAGESSLRNLDYGDTAGPDSRGIFQQRGNWGSLADRMDPYTAALHFFARMRNVPGWSTAPPTNVAHLVQGNANPDYYTPFFPRAQKIVAVLTNDIVVPPPTALPVS